MTGQFRGNFSFDIRLITALALIIAAVFTMILAFGVTGYAQSPTPRPEWERATPQQPAELQPGGSPSRDTTAKKVAPWVIEHTVNEQQAEFMVVLADQADLSPADTMPTKTEKGGYVHNILWNKAQTTQGPIVQWLRERGLEHRSFYIVNAILVKGSREIAEALAARPDVARVEGNPHIQNLPQAFPSVETPLLSETPETIESGINYTRAPQVWRLGFTGQGIVIGSADTGVRWTHTALKPHYRGWNGTTANHNYNWHDSIHDSVGNPCGNNAQAPCDDLFHGTMTTGIAIGKDSGTNRIGMAPGAKWIGCRNMDQGRGTPARYIECMQFFLAPYPVNGTPAQGNPALAPDITTNSWGCPPSEGCSVTTLQAAVQAQQAAGIMMVVGAGNHGPNCSTMVDPPSFYQAAYTVGSLNTGTDTIASFSSRGPVAIDGSNRIKPDITAPGTNIRSSDNLRDTAYFTDSGTSYATPHIAGAMALLWSAYPGLQNNIAASRAALNNAAVRILSTQCGAAGPPNNVYGWGRVDVFAAVVPMPTDFNGDGKPDWVLYNPSTRQTAIWYMNNNLRVAGAAGPTLVTAWRLLSVADFNRDRHPDYLLFNPSTRQATIWYMNNNLRIAGAAGPTLPSGWGTVATGLFNGDLHQDFVLYNTSTHQTALWYMNNNLHVGAASGPTLPGGWQVVAIGDFDRDGDPDYLLCNSTTHATVIWYMNNNVHVGAASGPTLPGGWQVVGVADFNRDGKPDYLPSNPITRQTYIWYLNNNVLVSKAAGPTLPAGWSIVAP